MSGLKAPNHGTPPKHVPYSKTLKDPEKYSIFANLNHTAVLAKNASRQGNEKPDHGVPG
jgi:hypothetical protein